MKPSRFTDYNPATGRRSRIQYDGYMSYPDGGGEIYYRCDLCGRAFHDDIVTERHLKNDHEFRTSHHKIGFVDGH